MQKYLLIVLLVTQLTILPGAVLKNLIVASASALKNFEWRYARLMAKRDGREKDAHAYDNPLHGYVQYIVLERSEKLNFLEQEQIKEHMQEVEEAYQELYATGLNDLNQLDNTCREWTNWVPAELLLLDSRIAFWLSGGMNLQGDSFIPVSKRIEETTKLVEEFKSRYISADIIKNDLARGLWLAGASQLPLEEIRKKSNAVNLNEFIERIENQRRSNLSHEGVLDNSQVWKLLWEHNGMLKAKDVLTSIYTDPEPEDPVAQARYKKFWNFLVELDKFVKDTEMAYAKHLIANGVKNINERCSVYILHYLLATRFQDGIDISKIDFSSFYKYRDLLQEYQQKFREIGAEIVTTVESDSVFVSKLSSRAQVLSDLEFVINFTLKK